MSVDVVTNLSDLMLLLPTVHALLGVLGVSIDCGFRVYLACYIGFSETPSQTTWDFDNYTAIRS